MGPQILKIPELGLAFVTLMVHREGEPNVSNMSSDDILFSTFVIYSFFFIVLVQLLGILLGDKSPVQDVIYAITGAIFYVAAGAAVLDGKNAFGGPNDASKGLGSMAIITGAVFVVDTGFALLSLKNET